MIHFSVSNNAILKGSEFFFLAIAMCKRQVSIIVEKVTIY